MEVDVLLKEVSSYSKEAEARIRNASLEVLKAGEVIGALVQGLTPNLKLLGISEEHFWELVLKNSKHNGTKGGSVEAGASEAGHSAVLPAEREERKQAQETPVSIQVPLFDFAGSCKVVSYPNKSVPQATVQVNFSQEAAKKAGLTLTEKVRIVKEGSLIRLIPTKNSNGITVSRKTSKDTIIGAQICVPTKLRPSVKETIDYPPNWDFAYDTLFSVSSKGVVINLSTRQSKERRTRVRNPYKGAMLLHFLQNLYSEETLYTTEAHPTLPAVRGDTRTYFRVKTFDRYSIELKADTREFKANAVDLNYELASGPLGTIILPKACHEQLIAWSETGRVIMEQYDELKYRMLPYRVV